MKTRSLRIALNILIGGVVSALILPLAAHPGGLDANGGHNDRKNGGYHYHRNPPATGATQPVTPKQESAPAQAPKTKETAGFWITSSSGVRHNEKCRYFKTSKGRPCTKDEGRACKICGG